MKWFFFFAIVVAARGAEMKFEPSASLQRVIDQAVENAAMNFSSRSLRVDQLAATVVDLRDTNHLRVAAHRGAVKIYPASVIKLFYLEAAHRWLEDGKISESAELRRAMSDMIVHSYNEATHYIIDLLTDTTSGPELPPEEMVVWAMKRNGINRYFQSRGYNDINANQKPWCEGPYGRDRFFVGQTYTNRNMLTTDSTARLLAEIALGRAVSAARCSEMLALMTRAHPDDQAQGFTGPAVPRGAKLWSKAGWTSQTRHDAALIELPNGARFVIVIFTVDHANERGIIPAIAKPIIAEFAQ